MVIDNEINMILFLKYKSIFLQNDGSKINPHPIPRKREAIEKKNNEVK